MIRVIAIVVMGILLLAVVGYAVMLFFVIPRNWHPLTLSVSFADLDGDGDLDALVGNGHTDDTGWPNTVWYNDGSGRFTDSGQQLGEDYESTLSIALIDLDGDGDLDAVFGNNWTHTVWRNNGQGQFSRITGLSIAYSDSADGHSSGYFGGMAVGDVNGDGSADVVAGSCCRGEWVAYNDQGEVGRGINDSYTLVFLGTGDGRFGYSSQRLDNNSTGGVALGDLNGNGHLDLFVANLRTTFEEGDYRDQVWFNDGRGTFTDSGQRLGEQSSSAVALGDLNGNGHLDVYVGSIYYPRSPRDVSNDASRIDQVWLNDGTGNFTPGPQPNGLVDTRFVALADLDGDGDLDAFVASRTEAFILWNDGSGDLSRLGPGFSPGRDYAYNIADVDGDGLPDVFAIHLTRGYIVWRNLGGGEFQQQR
jgi:hypothetical protein